MLPARLQETRHTTSGNLPGVDGVFWDAVGDGSRAVFTHGAVGVSFVQMSTDLSYDRDKDKGVQNHIQANPYTRTCEAVAI